MGICIIGIICLRGGRKNRLGIYSGIYLCRLCGLIDNCLVGRIGSLKQSPRKSNKIGDCYLKAYTNYRVRISSW